MTCDTCGMTPATVKAVANDGAEHEACSDCASQSGWAIVGVVRHEGEQNDDTAPR